MDDLVRLSRGLWRPATAVTDLPSRCAALLTVCPPGSVLAGRTAAELHGLWLPAAVGGRIDVIVRRAVEVPRDGAGGRRPEIRVRRRVLRPDEIVLVGGNPVTCEARTWVDLAEELSMADLVASGDCVLRGSTPRVGLQEMITRAGHRRGVVHARAALPLLNARSRSRPESHLRYVLVSHGLPEPEVNQPIFNAVGEWLAEPDLHYRQARLALEYNGAIHADPAQMRKDFTRDIDVQHRGGWRTVTFGPDQVFKRPDQTAAFVSHLLRERLAEMAHRAA